jgi:hypothetical protein
MKTNKATKLFQTMAIVSLNTGNLILEVNTLKNMLVMGIMWKSRGRTG